MDGKEWKKVSEVKATAQAKARKTPTYVPPASLPDPITWMDYFDTRFYAKR